MKVCSAGVTARELERFIPERAVPGSARPLVTQWEDAGVDEFGGYVVELAVAVGRETFEQVEGWSLGDVEAFHDDSDRGADLDTPIHGCGEPFDLLCVGVGDGRVGCERLDLCADVLVEGVAVG